MKRTLSIAVFIGIMTSISAFGDDTLTINDTLTISYSSVNKDSIKVNGPGYLAKVENDSNYYLLTNASEIKFDLPKGDNKKLTISKSDNYYYLEYIKDEETKKTTYSTQPFSTVLDKKIYIKRDTSLNRLNRKDELTINKLHCYIWNPLRGDVELSVSANVINKDTTIVREVKERDSDSIIVRKGDIINFQIKANKSQNNQNVLKGIYKDEKLLIEISDDNLIKAGITRLYEFRDTIKKDTQPFSLILKYDQLDEDFKIKEYTKCVYVQIEEKNSSLWLLWGGLVFVGLLVVTSLLVIQTVVKKRMKHDEGASVDNELRTGEQEGSLNLSQEEFENGQINDGNKTIQLPDEGVSVDNELRIGEQEGSPNLGQEEFENGQINGENKTTQVPDEEVSVDNGLRALEDLQHKLQDVQDELEKVRSEKKTASDDLIKKDDELVALRVQLNEAKRMVIEERNHANSLQSKLATMGDEFSKVNRSLDEFQKQIQKQDETIATLSQDKDCLEKKNLEIQKQTEEKIRQLNEECKQSNEETEKACDERISEIQIACEIRNKNWAEDRRSFLDRMNFTVGRVLDAADIISRNIDGQDKSFAESFDYIVSCLDEYSTKINGYEGSNAFDQVTNSDLETIVRNDFIELIGNNSSWINSLSRLYCYSRIPEVASVFEDNGIEIKSLDSVYLDMIQLLGCYGICLIIPRLLVDKYDDRIKNYFSLNNEDIIITRYTGREWLIDHKETGLIFDLGKVAYYSYGKVIKGEIVYF